MMVYGPTSSFHRQLPGSGEETRAQVHNKLTYKDVHHNHV